MKQRKNGKLNPEEIQHLRRCGLYTPNKNKTHQKRALRRFAVWWETTAMEKSLEDILFLLKNLALLDIINLLASITIIISLITWWTGRTERWEDEIFSTWQVVNEAFEDQSGVVKIALERLLRNKFSLAGLKLYKTDLAEANLQEADLWKANLQKAYLIEANLQKAYLIEANLQKAYLWEANLQKAYLEGADLQEADLWKVNLQEANLEGAKLQKADLQEANLQEANLWKANLQEANLWKANLQEADLYKANLQKADLQEANLQEADLSATNLQKADLYKANLQETYYTDENTPNTVCKKLFLKYPCPTIFPDNFDPKSHNMIPITTLEQLDKIR